MRSLTTNRMAGNPRLPSTCSQDYSGTSDVVAPPEDEVPYGLRRDLTNSAGQYAISERFVIRKVQGRFDE